MGSRFPRSTSAGKRFSTMTGDADGKLMLAPVEPFAQHGQCGAWVSDFLPHTAQIADDLCFIKSMHTDAVNHAPAITFLPHRRRAARPADAGRVADLRPRQRDARTCPASW